MRCREARRLIRGYLAGELTGAALGEVERHARDCDRCRRFYEEAKRYEALMEKALVGSTPVERVMMRIRRMAPRTARLRRSVIWMVLIAVCGMLFIALAYVGLAVHRSALAWSEMKRIGETASRSAVELPEDAERAVGALLVGAEWPDEHRRSGGAYADPWGTPYRLVRGPEQWRVDSAGPDRVFGTEDDLRFRFAPPPPPPK